MTVRAPRPAGVAAVASTLLLAACASTSPPGAASNPDPWEKVNRPIARFNDRLDRYALKPAAQFYANWFPPMLRFVAGNFFSNLEDVYTSANQLLQGKPYEALTDATRVLVNSTLGFGGLGDPASEIGLRKHHEDFGQTLGRWGVPSGPYLVLPLLGPSSLRDAPARYVTGRMDPVFWSSNQTLDYSVWAARSLHERADLLPKEGLLDGITFDRYSLIRDGYLQMRLNAVYDGNVPPSAAPASAADPGGAAGAAGAAMQGAGDDDFDPGPSGAGGAAAGAASGAGGAPAGAGGAPARRQPELPGGRVWLPAGGGQDDFDPGPTRSAP